MGLLGIDAGTSVVKAVLFDDDWSVVRTAEVPVVVDRPHPGWAEQDPAVVVAAAFEVVRRATTGPGPEVDVLAVTGQGDGCWLVDAAGHAVRPAMLWNDARAADVVQRWDDDGLLERAFRRTGSYGFAGLAHAQLAWLAEHEPDTLGRAQTLLSCGSVLHAALTGRRVLDVSEASNPFLAADGSGYDEDLLGELGLSWARRLLPEVVAGPGRLGTLLPEVAQTLGLRAGTAAVLAPYDVVATGVGLGALTPTSAMTVLGTTLAVGVASPDAATNRAPSGSALDLGTGDGFMLLYATLAGTEVLEWARRLLGLPDAAAVVRLAAGSVPGPGTPLVLPYLSPAGERTPFRDPLARGAVLGLELTHTPADVARGVLEGLTLAVADCIGASGAHPRRLVLSGGGSRSDAWCQLLADACGLEVERGAGDQVGALGAAMVGAVGAGSYPDMAAVTAAAVHPGRVFTPAEAEVHRLATAAQRYRAAREAGVHRA